MKRFIIHISTFMIFAVVVYIALIILFGNYAPSSLKQNLHHEPKGYMALKSQEAEKIDSIDVLILGSSRAYRGYDPRIFQQAGINIFNLGSSSQTPIQSAFFIDKYLEKLNPKAVILDIYPEMFESDGVESSLDLIANGNTDIASVAIQVNDIKVYNTLIYGLYHKIFIDYKDFKASDMASKDVYIKGGYVESYNNFAPTLHLHSKPCLILPKQLRAFKRIVNKIQIKNIKLFLIQSPITKNSYNICQNNDELDKLFAQYGTYYNFNKVLSLPDSLFYDEIHLNQYGVNMFNRKLLEVIGDSLMHK